MSLYPKFVQKKPPFQVVFVAGLDITPLLPHPSGVTRRGSMPLRGSYQVPPGYEMPIRVRYTQRGMSYYPESVLFVRWAVQISQTNERWFLHARRAAVVLCGGAAQYHLNDGMISVWMVWMQSFSTIT
jgi:hypothetical protein